MIYNSASLAILFFCFLHDKTMNLPAAASDPLDLIAERYVRLVLAIGQHDTYYVDAYYGPPEWQQQAASEQQALASIAEGVRQALQLLNEVEAEAEAAPLERASALRAASLRKQLQSMQTRLAMLGGLRLSFEEESAQLYDAVSPRHERAWYASLVAQIDTLLPGSDSVSARVQAFRSHFVIAPERLHDVMTAAMDAGRKRTLEHFALPAEEACLLEFVTGKSWSGYNWYKGNYQSVIQINTDLPIYIDRAVDLGCHEAYPGHHVYNVLLERELVRGKGWLEYSVYPLFSPQSLIAEGTANYGIELCFSAEERLQFEQQVLFPLAGLDPALAPQYAHLNRLLAMLAYADNDIARQYLDGSLDRAGALEWLAEARLYPIEKAAQRLQFYDEMGAYVINYNLGQDMVKAYIERQGETRQAQWAAFRDLMSFPRVPSALR